VSPSAHLKSHTAVNTDSRIVAVSHLVVTAPTPNATPGLSLNLLCQQYADQDLRALIEGGTNVRCLFLAPYGTSIAEREREEGYPSGHLSALTEMNRQILLQRVRERLTEEARLRLQVATYDETIRFNMLLVDDEVGVVQPYLSTARASSLRPSCSGAGANARAGTPCSSRCSDGSPSRARPNDQPC
jgi:hypothetical protein